MGSSSSSNQVATSSRARRCRGSRSNADVDAAAPPAAAAARTAAGTAASAVAAAGASPTAADAAATAAGVPAAATAAGVPATEVPAAATAAGVPAAATAAGVPAAATAGVPAAATAAGVPAAAAGVPGATAARGALPCVFCGVLRGAVAGSVAKTLVYPLDRLKIHMQVKAAAEGRPFRLRDTAAAFREMALREGAIRGLWKGNACAFVRTFPYSGLSFYSFDVYNGILQQQLAPIVSPTFARLLAGAAAGMTATTATYPLDVLNTRMALTRHRLRYHQVSLLHVEGWRSLYRGLAPTMLGIVPYAGISFCTYETLKEQLQVNRDATFHPLWTALCGGAAGVTGQTASYPLDTLRKYMQAQTFLYRFQEPGHRGSASPTSMWRAFRFLWSRRGLRGLYNGVSLNWVKGFLAAGLAFSLNETGKLLLQPSPAASLCVSRWLWGDAADKVASRAATAVDLDAPRATDTPPHPPGVALLPPKHAADTPSSRLLLPCLSDFPTNSGKLSP